MDYSKKGTLILTSLLEDLDKQQFGPTPSPPVDFSPRGKPAGSLKHYFPDGGFVGLQLGGNESLSPRKPKRSDHHFWVPCEFAVT